jgi:hypothetical protein
VRPVRLALLCALLAGCYGRATPENCYRKYVVNGRGDGYEDTYDNCLARADVRRARVRAKRRGELVDSGGEWVPIAGAAAAGYVVGRNQK